MNSTIKKVVCKFLRCFGVPEDVLIKQGLMKRKPIQAFRYEIQFNPECPEATSLWRKNLRGKEKDSIIIRLHNQTTPCDGLARVFMKIPQELREEAVKRLLEDVGDRRFDLYATLFISGPPDLTIPQSVVDWYQETFLTEEWVKTQPPEYKVVVQAFSTITDSMVSMAA